MRRFIGLDALATLAGYELFAQSMTPMAIQILGLS